MKKERLLWDSANRTQRYKMFKAGKYLVTASLSIVMGTLVLGENQLIARADKSNDGDIPASGSSNADVTTKTVVLKASVDSNTSVSQTSANQSNSQNVQSNSVSSAGSESVQSSSARSVTSAATTKEIHSESLSQNSQVSSSQPTAKEQASTTSNSLNQSQKLKGLTSETKEPAVSVASQNTKATSNSSAQAAKSIITAASSAARQVASYAAKDAILANKSKTDNIPDDSGLIALNKQQESDDQAILTTLQTATQVSSQSNQPITTDQIASAQNVLNSMQQAVVQAAVMVLDDEHGIQKMIVSQAQAALAAISLPIGTRAALDDYGDLIVTASNIGNYQQTVTNLTNNGLIKQFRNVIDPTEDTISLINPTLAGQWQGTATITTGENADGSTNYFLNTNATYNSVNFQIQVTGQSGDEYSVSFPDTVIDQWSGKGHFTGNPTITNTKKDGVNWNTYTWKIDAGVNSTQTVTQTAIGFTFFNEYPYNPNDLDTQEDMYYTGEQVPFRFQINGQDVSANQNATLTLNTTAQINSGGIKYTGLTAASSVTPKTTGVDYLYDVYLANNGVRRASALSIQVPVPSGFELDPVATQQYLTNRQTNFLNGGIMPNNVKVTQPGGAGTNIKITSTRDLAINQATIGFVGKYTTAETTGKSAGVFGWVDYGDGVHQVFGNTASFTGFDERVITATDSQIHEAFNVVVLGTDNLNNIQSFTYISDYDSQNSKGSTKDRFVTLTPGENNPGLPALFGVGVIGLGAQAFLPTYQITLPTQITSIGITMPFNNSTNTGADSNEYNTAQTEYVVTVIGNDGSQIVQSLTSGESYNPLTGVIDDNGVFLTGSQLVSGVQIMGYVVKPTTPYAANVIMNGGTESDPNDIASGLINILGYLNNTAIKGQEYAIGLQVSSANYLQKNKVLVYALPDQTAGKEAIESGTVNSVLTTGQTFVQGFTVKGIYVAKKDSKNQPNLDAGGFLSGKSNATSTDLPGGLMNPTPASLTIFEPVLYVTVPTGTQVVPNGVNLYKAGRDKANRTLIPTPKYTQLTNQEGQTVWKIDWTGTNYVMVPGDKFDFTFRVNENILAGFSPEDTYADYYEYQAADGSLSLKTADELKQMGVSTTGLVFHPASSNNGTTMFQLGGDVSNTTLSTKSQITLADKTKVNVTEVPTLNHWIQLIVQNSLGLVGQIRGTADTLGGFTGTGHNYPITDKLNNQGLQKMQFGVTNNTDSNVKNAVVVFNLPDQGIVDPNNVANGKSSFTLQLSNEASPLSSSDNNPKNDQPKIRYSTELVTSGNNQLTFADGAVWQNGSKLTMTEMLTVAQVTDWSKVKSVVMILPTLSKQNQVYYELSLDSPTSLNNSGLSTTLTTTLIGSSLSKMQNSVTDMYEVKGQVAYLDQDGNEINGYPVAIGSATQNADGSFTAVQPMGAPGDKFGDAPVIPGYLLTATTGDTVLKSDGSAKEVLHYQVDQAKLIDQLLNINETTKGDNTPSTGATTATGSNTISFSQTDTNLAKIGLTYQVSVVDEHGQPVNDGNGNHIYPSLATALANQGTFDNRIDNTGATQIYQVKYSLAPNVQMSLKSMAKPYDNDASTDPDLYQVTIPTILTAPSWVATDFDQTGITSQNVGKYQVKLSEQGWLDLEKANANIDFSLADPLLVKTGSGIAVTGIFEITQAPITISAPTPKKTYDGSVYSGTDNQAKISGLPLKGIDPVYTMTDISQDKDAKVYPIKVTALAADNPNYKVTVSDGSLTIKAQSLAKAFANATNAPANAVNAADNRPNTGSVQAKKSITIIGKSKNYDGDTSTDPTSLTVLGPSKYADFKLPEFTKQDFDSSHLTSQDVGNYLIQVNPNGLKKIQAANPNYLIKAEDIQNGLFVITPAPVTITVASISKVYDGKPISQSAVTASVTGKPQKGVAINYDLTQVGSFINVRDYPLTATATNDSNYTVSVIDGILSITKRPLTTAVGNRVDQPINPADPANNPPNVTSDQAKTSLTILGSAKVYDGDATTDPQLYQLLGPSDYPDFKIANITPADFDLNGITSQNVGGYTVRLSAAGLQKLITANPNYLITAADIENALLVIYPAPIELIGPTVQKVYDDQPYSGTLTVLVKGLPKLGISPKYKLINPNQTKVGTYDLDFLVNDDDNPNYEITKIPGKLDILPDGLTVTTRFVSTSGQTLAPAHEQTDLNLGDLYQTTALQIAGYTLLAAPANAMGKLGKANVTVTYLYEQIVNSQPTVVKSSSPVVPSQASQTGSETVTASSVAQSVQTATATPVTVIQSQADVLVGAEPAAFSMAKSDLKTSAASMKFAKQNSRLALSTTTTKRVKNTNRRARQSVTAVKKSRLPQREHSQLPQTGERDNAILSLLGVTILGLLAGAYQRRKHFE